jgi:hypothetical protein
MFHPVSVGTELDLSAISLLWQALMWLSFLILGEGNGKLMLFDFGQSSCFAAIFAIGRGGCNQMT